MASSMSAAELKRRKHGKAQEGNSELNGEKIEDSSQPQSTDDSLSSKEMITAVLVFASSVLLLIIFIFVSMRVADYYEANRTADPNAKQRIAAALQDLGLDGWFKVDKE